MLELRPLQELLIFEISPITISLRPRFYSDLNPRYAKIVHDFLHTFHEHSLCSGQC